ncbi:MAG: hypothetical protein K2F81_03855 [Ruminococcus sp.]|nr:hypothetical protein [Ruminococcus sp.]
MYDTIKLEKGLYSITGKNFTQALEALDPDSNYKGTELEGLDAFERQLKRFDIKIAGKNSDKVEKFFLSTESAVLFPEYIRRTIKQGMDDISILNHISASVYYTHDTDFKGITMGKNTNASASYQLGELPFHNVKLNAVPSSIQKFGRGLKFSYESICKQRIDTLGVILRRLGTQISKEINIYAINIVTSGLTPAEIEGTQITYNELAAFFSSMSECNMTSLICSPAVLAKIVSMEEMKNSQYDYMSSGVVKTPFGIDLIKCTGLSDDIAVGIDKSCAIETAFGSDVIVDYDKLISNQCTEIFASVSIGFSKLIDGSILTTKITDK